MLIEVAEEREAIGKWGKNEGKKHLGMERIDHQYSTYYNNIRSMGKVREEKEQHAPTALYSAQPKHGVK